MSKRKICVVGAGVIGLSAAMNILESLPNVEVTVVAEEFSPHTTSDGAAGFWMPHALSNTAGHQQMRWGKATWDYLEKILNSDEGARAGIHAVSGWVFHKEKGPDPIWKDTVIGFRHVTGPELAVHPEYKDGWFFTTIICACADYLPWLMAKYKENGGKVLQGRVGSLAQLASQYDVVVNCTGIGAKQLVGDDSVHPIRGQVFKVQAGWAKNFMISGEADAYILPGPKAVVMGGTHQEGDWNTEPDRTDSHKIWKNCCRLMPSIKDAKVERQWAGLRPARPSVRLEWEMMSLGGRKVPVVHNYGHGGGGITLHWGCANDATELVRQSLEQLNTKARL